MTCRVVQVSIYGETPLARLVRPQLDVITVSEIDLAVADGCVVELRGTDTPGEPFDDRPRALRLGEALR